MNVSTQTILKATWRREPPAADRWQTLHAQLPVSAISAASAWTRRSPVICRWRALPADVWTRSR